MLMWLLMWPLPTEVALSLRKQDCMPGTLPSLGAISWVTCLLLLSPERGKLSDGKIMKAKNNVSGLKRKHKQSVKYQAWRSLDVPQLQKCRCFGCQYHRAFSCCFICQSCLASLISPIGCPQQQKAAIQCHLGFQPPHRPGASSTLSASSRMILGGQDMVEEEKSAETVPPISPDLGLPTLLQKN